MVDLSPLECIAADGSVRCFRRPHCHYSWLRTVVHAVVVCVCHLTVGTCKSLYEVGMEVPVADGGLGVLPLDARLLGAKLNRQVLDGFSIHGVDVRQSRANATYVCS